MKISKLFATLRRKDENTKGASEDHSFDQKWKKESGSGGPLIYAMCFVGFVIIVTLFIFVEYRSKIFLLKDDMETNLHVVENYCITVNQKSGTTDEFERERERAHIITAGVHNNSNDPGQIAIVNEQRKKQADEIGKAFARQIASEFDLNGNIVRSGYIRQMSKDPTSPATLNISEVRIYDPKYQKGEVYPVYCQDADTHLHEENCKKKGYLTNSDEPTGFWIKQDVETWYTFVLTFDDNNAYVGCTMTTSNTAPKMYNGVSAEGATIESKIVATFYPPDSFFGFQRNMMSVEVCEAIDIVFSSEDSRKR